MYEFLNLFLTQPHTPTTNVHSPESMTTYNYNQTTLAGQESETSDLILM